MSHPARCDEPPTLTDVLAAGPPAKRGARDEHVESTAPAEYAESKEERARHRRVNRRIDIALLPLLSFLYLFNGLDRGNVGNAQTQGFMNDIGAAPEDLNFAVAIFFVTFVTFQPFSAAVGRWLGPKHWIPLLMFSWGMVTIGQAFVSGRGSLIATRLLIGAFEAGFYATAVSYLSYFYRRYDLAVRLALFYGQYAIAGAFSGTIAYGVFQLRGCALENWQYLFIIEGSATCLMAIVGWMWLPSGPETAWFLSRDDRIFAADRIRRDSEPYVGGDSTPEERLTRRDIVETVRDWKLWCMLLFNMCASVPSQAFSVFLPLVVQGMGFSSLDANLMSVPPYIIGALGLYLFALSSDRRRDRGFHIVGGILIAIVGLIIVVAVRNNRARYVGLCIFLFGTYVPPPLTMVWLAGNTPAPGKRSLVLGVNGWGNLAGVIGSQLYRPEYSPRYMLPFYTTLGIMIVALLGYLANRFLLRYANTKKLHALSLMSREEVESERVDTVRYADKKRTFIYGL
ncbi:Nicotinamide mononucleotide permease [Pleurostoma richardsiae]|uniref:Nicotinamide mononucleotide permease n=1 Tax=Pleurostoma richardsiae TaxID=41990 RepID=A0AA38REF9_9PEZI|nr:Nicotinamide mononucleotide permease [Pleurostoma richardsiae]